MKTFQSRQKILNYLQHQKNLNYRNFRNFLKLIIKIMKLIFKEIPANYKSWIEDVKNRNVQISDIAMKKFFYSPKELGTLSDFAKSNNINILKPSGNEYLD